jgi:DNA helicase HerA-like ATPase
MKRIGRSFNNFLVLITQSTNDLDDSEDGTGFGTVICFDVTFRRRLKNPRFIKERHCFFFWIS